MPKWNLFYLPSLGESAAQRKREGPFWKYNYCPCPARKKGGYLKFFLCLVYLIFRHLRKCFINVVMQEEESAHTDDLASYDWDGERDLIDISSTEVNEILASVRYFGSQKRMLTRMNM